MRLHNPEKPALWLLCMALICGAISPMFLYVGLSFGGIGGHGGDWTVWTIGLGFYFTAWALIAGSVSFSLITLRQGKTLKWWSIFSIFLLIAASILGIWGLQG